MCTQKKIIGYCVIGIGSIFAPFLPFFALLVFPVFAVTLTAPVAALLFSVFFDSLLLPTGASLWTSLSWYTILSIPLYMYIRHITTL